MRGGLEFFLLEIGDKPKPEKDGGGRGGGGASVDVEVGEGGGHFIYYFTVQSHLLCVLEKLSFLYHYIPQTRFGSYFRKKKIFPIGTFENGRSSRTER